MSKSLVFDKKFVKKIAELSKIKLTDEEDEYFSKQFNKTLETIGNLGKLDTTNTPEAYNITGLKNVYREDVIDKDRLLTQKEALSGAKRTHNGFFVVKGILK